MYIIFEQCNFENIYMKLLSLSQVFAVAWKIYKMMRSKTGCEADFNLHRNLTTVMFYDYYFLYEVCR